MASLSVYIPSVPDEWASYTALEYLFQKHQLGVVRRVSLGRSPDGLGIDAQVRFACWYDTRWSRHIRDTLLVDGGPAYVALLGSEEFVALHRLQQDDAIDGIKRDLAQLRRQIGVQCMTCSNRNDLEEDDDEFGSFYCSACWFARNNAEAIRAKERDIGEMERKITKLWTSEDPHSAYRVEELLERIQERRDEIAMLRNA